MDKKGEDRDHRSRRRPSPGGVASGADGALLRVIAYAAQVIEEIGPNRGR
ncbi:MAG TPA: hypothetical protein VN203_27815 [Candidatus Acidoferrum sp.]|nr:hypothetical protein [Candidatus Acidoferrum sp.]